MKQVVKRDGKAVKFNLKKIVSAIRRAGESTGEYGYDEALELTNDVLQRFEGKEEASVEDIQDTVEDVLSDAGYKKTAKAYILYREQHNKLRNDNAVLIDAVKSIDDYLDRSDWRVNANANQGYSLGGMILNTSGKVTANYWLSHVYPKEAGEAHRNGDIQIHDLDMLSSYTYSPDEIVTAIVGGKAYVTRFVNLYEMCNAEEVLEDEENGVWCKYPKNIKVLDKGFRQVEVTRLTRKLCHRPMVKIITEDGEDLTVTDNHPVIVSTDKNNTVNAIDSLGLEQYNFYTNKWVKIVAVEEVKFDGKYIYDITTETGTLIVNKFWCHNCTGWSLRSLLQEGFNGVAGKVESNPPKHLGSALGQMVNFLGCLQNENAGAQAFSSFDTYLAPYVRNDKLTYKQVYDAIQEFVFNVNVPSRWGCVLPDTEILTKDGWKKYTDLKLAEDIIGFRDGELVDDIVNKINEFNFEGKLVKITTSSSEQVLTPTHRVIGKGVDEKFYTVNAEDFFTKRELKLPVLCEDLKSVKYEEVDSVEWYGYEGKVWCPSTDCTYWVAKNGSGVFITGNTQTPFTNITLDWTCPEDLKDSQPIIAGEEMDYTYSELQPEMDMINKAFIEVMINGDAKGRLFTFPIPTYNITPDFPWESENTTLLFEMTAKYGLPYFQNFLNSDLKVGDVRSMCPLLGNTRVWCKKDDVIKPITLKYMYTQFKKGVRYEVWDGEKWCEAAVNRQEDDVLYHITFENGADVYMGSEHLQYVPELKDSIPAKELQKGMMLPFNTTPFDLVSIDTSKMKKVYDFYTYMIVAIEKIEGNKEHLYCLELDNDNHLFTLENGLLTHNCRLQLDLREIRKRGGGLFGSGEQTGSVGVITINCARLGYLFKGDLIGLYKQLDHWMEVAKNALEQKRKALVLWMEQGLYPYSKRYLGTYNTLFSTIGINGVNEMIRNFTNDEHDITDNYGQDFAIKLMDHIREKLVEFQVETGNLYNLEATPGEGTTFRFAKEDSKRFSDIIQAGTKEAPYYTNSTQLPVGYTDDPFTALNLQEELQKRYTGGTVVHLYMGERVSSSEVCKTLVRRVLENYRVPYITITPTFSICPKHGYISGEHKYCPICDEELSPPKLNDCSDCK